MRGSLDLPRVTICVPVRNGSRTIRRTLDSILSQDYPNLEVIVCDNCSTDDTAQIIQEYAERGVKYYLNPKLEASGESNWNHVLTLAQGPLIALYHADDLYTSTMVRRQVEFLQRYPDVSAVFAMTQIIDEQDRPVRVGSRRLHHELRGQKRFDFPTVLNGVLKDGNFLIVPTMMTRRETLDTVGVFRWEMFASASDIDLYLRMAKEWGPIGVIDEPLHRYRVSLQQGSVVIQKNRTRLADFFFVLNTHLEDSTERQFAEVQSLALYEVQIAVDKVLCAMNLLELGNIAEAQEFLKEALQTKHFVTALHRLRLLARLFVGAGLLSSTWFGLGHFVGHSLYQAYQWDLRRRQQPLAKGIAKWQR